MMPRGGQWHLLARGDLPIHRCRAQARPVRDEAKMGAAPTELKGLMQRHLTMIAMGWHCTTGGSSRRTTACRSARSPRSPSGSCIRAGLRAVVRRSAQLRLTTSGIIGPPTPGCLPGLRPDAVREEDRSGLRNGESAEAASTMLSGPCPAAAPTPRIHATCAASCADGAVTCPVSVLDCHRVLEPPHATPHWPSAAARPHPHRPTTRSRRDHRTGAAIKPTRPQPPRPRLGQARGS